MDLLSGRSLVVKPQPFQAGYVGFDSHRPLHIFARRRPLYQPPAETTICRSPIGCGGRLFGPWVSDCSMSTWSGDTVPMPCITIHRTPSEHGGVVSEPLYP